METRYEKIIKKLEQLNQVPISELNTELSKLRMHIYDWEELTCKCPIDVELPVYKFPDNNERRKKIDMKERVRIYDL